jgi:hypothetical protein
MQRKTRFLARNGNFPRHKILEPANTHCIPDVLAVQMFVNHSSGCCEAWSSFSSNYIGQDSGGVAVQSLDARVNGRRPTRAP